MKRRDWCALVALSIFLPVGLVGLSDAQEAASKKAALACPKCGKPGTGKFCSEDGAELANADAVALHAILTGPQPAEVGRGLANPLAGIAKDGKVDVARLKALVDEYDALVKAGRLGTPAPAAPGALPKLATTPAFKLEGKDEDGDATCIAVTVDGTYLCVGHEKGRVVFWDIAGRSKATSADHLGSKILSVAAHPLAPLVGHASPSLGLKFTLVKSTRRPALREEAGVVTRLAFSPDGTHLATGSDKGELTVWDLWSATALRKVAASSAAISGISFDPAGSTVAVAGEDGKLVVADATSGKLLCELAAHEGGCTCVAQSAETVASGGVDGTVRLFTPRGKALRQFVDTGNAATSLAFHPSAAVLAAASSAGKVRLWGTARATLLTEIACSKTVSAVAWNPDGSGLWVASGGAVAFHEVVR